MTKLTFFSIIFTLTFSGYTQASENEDQLITHPPLIHSPLF